MRPSLALLIRKLKCLTINTGLSRSCHGARLGSHSVEQQGLREQEATLSLFEGYMLCQAVLLYLDMIVTVANVFAVAQSVARVLATYVRAAVVIQGTYQLWPSHCAVLEHTHEQARWDLCSKEGIALLRGNIIHQTAFWPINLSSTAWSVYKCTCMAKGDAMATYTDYMVEMRAASLGERATVSSTGVDGIGRFAVAVDKNLVGLLYGRNLDRSSELSEHGAVLVCPWGEWVRQMSLRERSAKVITNNHGNIKRVSGEVRQYAAFHKPVCICCIAEAAFLAISVRCVMKMRAPRSKRPGTHETEGSAQSQ